AEVAAGRDRDAARASEKNAQDSAAIAHDESTKAKAAQANLRRTLYASNLNLIQTAWEANNLGRVLELLEETRPGQDEEDLRRFEWHYWNRLCHGDLQTWHFGASGIGRGNGKLSPDGARYAALVPGDGDKPGVVKV